MLLRKTFLALAFMLSASVAFPQVKTHYTKKEMKKEPVWIAMIKDDNVNYFQALKAFELYFSVHKFPIMEEEEMGKNNKLNERIEKSQKKLAKRKHKVTEEASKKGEEEHEAAKLAFEVKRFEHWEMQTRPYVKEDGSVMSADERLKIWNESKAQ